MKSDIIGIGELLWDMLPSGPQMGGAPANFACHARSLGASAAVISRVGAGAEGAELINRLAGSGLATTGVSVDPIAPTGVVDVTLGHGGQPHYTIRQNVAWDHIVVTPELLEMSGKAAAISFGTLSQRSEISRASIRQIVSNAAPGALKILDLNLRQNFFSAGLIHESLHAATVVKLNDDELALVAPLLGIQESNPRQQMAALLDRYHLRMIACTRGGAGSLLYDGSTWSEHHGVETRVADTIGAGDSFTAALTMGLLNGWPLGQISDAANLIAAHVCSCTGATPPLPGHLKTLFHPAAQPS